MLLDVAEPTLYLKDRGRGTYREEDWIIILHIYYRKWLDFWFIDKDPFQLKWNPKLNLIKKRLKWKQNIDMKQERGVFQFLLVREGKMGV